MLDNSLDYFAERAEAFLTDVWGDRDMGMPTLAIDWTKPPTRQQVTALLRLYPFIQVVSSKMEAKDSIVPAFKKASSGWIVHDYDQAMSVSLGLFLYQPMGVGSALEEDGDGDGKRKPRGSIMQQCFDTADEMVEMAMKKGWPGIQVVSGTEFMTWSLWMAAEDKGYNMVGYDPTDADRKKRLKVLNFRSERKSGAHPSAGPRD